MHLPVLDTPRPIPPQLDEDAADPGAPLTDRFGRTLGYLRLSVTKACSMRCVYCRPEALDHPRGEPLMSAEEIGSLVEHLAAAHGLRKVRLTGGEPTARPHITHIIQRIARVPGIDDLAMTTNGLTLLTHARQYASAGLRRINVSLDSLDEQKFADITGVDAMHRVIAGIDAATAAGLGPVKLNTVVVRGFNEHELPALIGFAADRNVEIRFIELMPMGPLASSWRQRYVDAPEMRRLLSGLVTRWSPRTHGSESARSFDATLADGRVARVGFITPMSCDFCAACDRLRVAADGAWYPCLMDHPAGNLLSALRPALDPDRLDALLRAGLRGKARRHPATGPNVMTHIGG